jgi:aryl-alcohol dehydrogenase-like predicted oxidoreductase
MRYRKLGRSGLLVSELCLGTGMFGGGDLEFWKSLGGLDQSAVNAVVGRAVEGGINFVDTADGYSSGQSEMRLGQALKDLKIARSEIVICTKAGMAMAGDPNGGGASRAHLIDACERSLKRLGTDYIDVYILHLLDPVTPFEESLSALDDLVHAGKIRYAGCSNFTAWEVMKALGISEREGLIRFQVVESYWSIAARGLEREIVPLARSEGVGIMGYGAHLGGILTGKYQRDGSSDQAGHRGGSIPPPLERNKVHDIVDAMREIARAHDVTPAEIALAFLLQEKAATSIIFGSTNPDQVAANLKASGLVLAEEELKRLDELSALPPDPFYIKVAESRGNRAQYVTTGPAREDT